MPQFFVTVPSGETRCRIEGPDFEHLTRVRRVRAGDTVTLRNSDGTLLPGRVTEIFDSSMAVEILGRKEAADSSYSFTLGIGILKGWKFDLVIQKAVEIGITAIVPLMTERSVPHIEGKEGKKLARWRKIALEASKQSLRSQIPGIAMPCDFYSFIAGIQAGDKFIAHPGDDAAELKELMKTTVRADTITLLIGPEGGFSEKEVGAALAAGFKAFRVGTNCMRAETAAIVLPAIFMYEWSDYV